MEPARVRIESHRLMRPSSVEVGTGVSESRVVTQERMLQKRILLKERSKLHVLVFFLSFIFATGTATLLVLVFVKSSENLLRLVLTGVVSAGAFVAVFAWMRYLLLSHPNMYTIQADDDEHHVTKSIAYGFIALVIALVLAGLIITTASASTVL